MTATVIKKIHNEIVSGLLRGDRIGFCKKSFGDRYLITIQGFYAYILPKENLYIRENLMEERDFSQLVEEIKEKGSFLTKQKTEDGAVMFYAENSDLPIWVKEKYLKKFDKDAQLYGTLPQNPILIVKKKECLGLVMPTRRN